MIWPNKAGGVFTAEMLAFDCQQETCGLFGKEYAGAPIIQGLMKPKRTASEVGAQLTFSTVQMMHA